MTGIHLPGDRVAEGDMQVEIGFPVLPGHIPHQGGDLKLALAAAGEILFFHRIKNADGHIVGGAQSGHTAQLHLLLLYQLGEGGDHLLAGIQPQHIALIKFPILHKKSSFRKKKPQTRLVCGFVQQNY